MDMAHNLILLLLELLKLDKTSEWGEFTRPIQDLATILSLADGILTNLFWCIVLHMCQLNIIIGSIFW
jgi:hypothetical protein